eukprot:scaffold748_cov329-Pavlova_lutheri.AAC.14
MDLSKLDPSPCFPVAFWWCRCRLGGEDHSVIVVLCCVGAYPVHSILLLQPSHSHIRPGGGDPVSCVLIGPSTRPFLWSTRLVDRRNLGKREDSSRRFLRSKGNSGSDRREDIPVCEGLGCSPSVPLEPPPAPVASDPHPSMRRPRLASQRTKRNSRLSL